MRNGKALATRSNAATSDSSKSGASTLWYPFAVGLLAEMQNMNSAASGCAVYCIASSFDDDINPHSLDSLNFDARLARFRYSDQQLMLD
jgi:hypothetical protein